MHLLKHFSSTGTIMLTIMILPYLTSSAPTNATSSTSKGLLAVSPVNLAADQCPTPPTEFLPYPPPSGYSPGPGCPPASSGTQPSEGNAPAGVYGGSGSGSGSSSQSTSSALSLKGRNTIGRFLRRFLPYRNRREALSLHSDGSDMDAASVGETDWEFNGMKVFGGAVEGF